MLRGSGHPGPCRAWWRWTSESGRQTRGSVCPESKHRKPLHFRASKVRSAWLLPTALLEGRVFIPPGFQSCCHVPSFLPRSCENWALFQIKADFSVLSHVDLVFPNISSFSGPRTKSIDRKWPKAPGGAGRTPVPLPEAHPLPTCWAGCAHPGQGCWGPSGPWGPSTVSPRTPDSFDSG